MKRDPRFALLRRCPAQGASRGRRAAFWLWNWALLLGCAALLGAVCLVLAPAGYGWPVFWDYWNVPAVILLNLLPPMVLSALLYGALGRTWLALLLTALPCLGLSLGNYYKLAFRDDPVIFSDLLILSEAKKMAGQYRLFFFQKLPAALAVTALCVLLLALLARGRPRRRGRLGAVLVSLAVACALIPAYASDRLYDQSADLTHLNRWSSTQQYVARGFLYPFLHSVKDALPDPPEGYSQREVDEVLSRYADGDIPEERKVNVVGVMLEAFADFSVYDQLEFTQDVYALYHQLEAESYSGNLLTNIFAGGTVNTERAFLTGVPSGDYDYRKDSASYVWYFRSQGYQTSGDHPCNNWFYNRRNINAYLGFQQYRFSEDHYAALSGGDTANDNIFFPELTASVLEQLESDKPLFSFSVSYQGHGPYSDTDDWWGDPGQFIANYDLDAASRTILGNYFGSQMITQTYLMEMVDAFRDSEEPIVLVVFGDHKPWLGNNSSVYHALGIDLTGDSRESFYSYWSTRYLIWANDAAKEALGNDFVGQGPDVSPCFLMSLLFEQCGWQGDAYMQAIRDCRQAVPVVHATGQYLLADGTLTGQLSETQRELIRRLEWLGYDRTINFESGKEG